MEYLSFSKNYKLIIKNKYKGKLYDKLNNLCGKLKFEKEFCFCFFRKDNKEILIAGCSFNNFSIIHCHTGHQIDYQDKSNDFLWKNISQINENTLLIFGEQNNTNVYKFFDFTDFFSKPIELPILFESIPFENRIFELDFPSPKIIEDMIIYTKKEKRVHGVAKTKLHYTVNEIDMTVDEYLKQYEQENGYDLFLWEEKTYELDKVKIILKRIGDHMEVVEFWIDNDFGKDLLRQENKEKQQTLEESSIKFQKLKSTIDKLEKYFKKIQYNTFINQNKICHIHLISKSIQSINYHISFEYFDDTKPYTIEFINLRNKDKNRKIECYEPKMILEMIEY
jgi:hypothetical protein